jgi:uroporphyrin-III C-methyltransferase/precorrin-2 dehydrogenase/sirohydrochlorin ferrochelatase
VTSADDVLPPAFFPVSLNVAGRRCVVIGPADDREAVEKERDLRECGADVRRIHDAAALRDEDVSEAFFVIATPQDEALAQRLRALADRHRFLLCCIDQPRYGFVAMQAIVKAGRARIAISTGGVSPRVGAILKAALEAALDATFARFLERLGERRRRARAEFPDDAERRRATMRAAADGFEASMRVDYPQWFQSERGAG